jgi:ribosomal protein S17
VRIEIENSLKDNELLKLKEEPIEKTFKKIAELNKESDLLMKKVDNGFDKSNMNKIEEMIAKYKTYLLKAQKDKTFNEHKKLAAQIELEIEKNDKIQINTKKDLSKSKEYNEKAAQLLEQIQTNLREHAAGVILIKYQHAIIDIKNDEVETLLKLYTPLFIISGLLLILGIFPWWINQSRQDEILKKQHELFIKEKKKPKKNSNTGPPPPSISRGAF